MHHVEHANDGVAAWKQGSEGIDDLSELQRQVGLLAVGCGEDGEFGTGVCGDKVESREVGLAMTGFHVVRESTVGFCLMQVAVNMWGLCLRMLM